MDVLDFGILAALKVSSLFLYNEHSVTSAREDVFIESSEGEIVKIV